jgi:nitroreductase
MNQSIQEIINRRYSCRSYLSEPIQEAHQQALKHFIQSQQLGPLGTHARFELIAATEEDRNSLKGLGTYGYIKNPMGFIVGALEQGQKNLEDFGYLFEQVVIAATDIGLGTCWLGGTFSKSNFAKRISLHETETMPAVLAAGYSADYRHNEELIQKHLSDHRRLPMEQLFFEGSFSTPLTNEAASAYLQPLAMVRRAPSASNKQPWRIVRRNNTWHFYLQRTKGYGKGTLLYQLMRLADLQRVDMGIAMCHFELTAVSLGLSGRWVVEEPKMQKPDNAEYTASWIASH